VILHLGYIVIGIAVLSLRCKGISEKKESWMLFRAALSALSYLSIGFITCNACVALEPQFHDPSHANLSEPQAESESYSYPTSSNLEQANPSRRPPVGFKAEWITDSDTGLANAKVDTTLPLLMFGTPPPLVKVGFAYTDLFAAESLGLPDELYEYSIGLAWVRPINERWIMRTMLGVGFATDNQNTSSDAWQFRGGAFAIYERSEQLKWTLGALATGRDDLPVIPAVGAVWQPNPCTRVDLLFPQPKVNLLISDDGSRQQWAYLGFGINGNTWAYEQPGMIDDRLTYKDQRVVMGWESRPSASAGMPFALGRTMRAEIGYAFSREFEFENETRVEYLGGGLMLGISTKF
jgi:hypothetical protein